MDIDPPAGFDSFFIVLSDTGDRKSYGIAFFCNNNECVGSKFFYFSFQGAVFQRGFVMIFVSYLDWRNGADIGSGKLSLIDDADLVAEHNAVFTFQPCVGNVKDIGFSVTGNSQICAVKILQCAGNFIHINTFFLGRIQCFLGSGI